MRAPITAPSPIRVPAPVHAEGAVAVVLVAGFVLAFGLSFSGRISADTALSASGCWLLIVLTFIAGWDLAAALWHLRPLEAFDNWRVPARLRAVLAPAALVVGLLLGHFVW